MRFVSFQVEFSLIHYYTQMSTSRISFFVQSDRCWFNYVSKAERGIYTERKQEEHCRQAHQGTIMK